MSGPALVVMAAGLGTRFGGPKQFFEAGPNGETLADYSLFDAWRAGFSRAVFVVREEHQELALRRFAGWKPRIAIETAVQDRPLGTVHAVWSARERLDGSFAVVNADDFYGRRAFEAMRRALEEAPGCGAIATYPIGETLSESGGVSRALCRVDASGWLSDVLECRGVRRCAAGIVADDRPGLILRDDDPVSMNFWGLPLAAIGLLESAMRRLERSRGDPKAELALPDAVADLLHGGSLRVRAIRASGWIGLTHRTDTPRVSEALRLLGRTGDYPALFAAPGVS